MVGGFAFHSCLALAFPRLKMLKNYAFSADKRL